jgi:hypothetical protein
MVEKLSMGEFSSSGFANRIVLDVLVLVTVQ